MDVYDMSHVKDGRLTLLGKFHPETDLRFYQLTLDGRCVCAGIAGTEELVFLRLCGEEQNKKRKKNCQDVKIVIAID